MEARDSLKKGTICPRFSRLNGYRTKGNILPERRVLPQKPGLFRKKTGMKNSTLAELLLALTEREREDFGLFVRSPYFNKGKEAPALVALSDTLSGLIARNAGDSAWDRAPVFESAYPGQTFSAKKLDNRMSLLLRLLRQFLVVGNRVGDMDSVDSQLALARQYLQHNLPKRFERVIRELDERLEALPYRDHRYFEHMALKAELQHTHEALYLHRHTDLHLKQAGKHAWLHYQARRLGWQTALHTYTRMARIHETPGFAPTDHETPLPDDIRQQYPILHLQEIASETLKKTAPPLADIEYFETCFQRCKAALPFEYRQYFAGLLRNLYTRRNNEEEPDVVRTIHRLHLEHLAEGYLFYTPGQLQVRTFTNIVTVALMVGEDAWVADFLENSRHNIVGDTEQRDCYRLARAQLLAFREQWQEALDILPGHFPRAEEDLVRARLEIILLYETRSPLLLPRLDAFKVYLGRLGKKALSATMKKRQGDFLNLVHQLLRARPGDIRRAQKILDRIHAVPNLPNKSWLLKKAGESHRICS
jgi:hypothetical protein